MTFETFDKCMLLVRAWRTRNGKEDYQWPDSRDPAITSTLEEFGVVPQDLEKSMVVLAAFREAEDDVYQAMSTSLQVIKNRQLKGKLRDHISAVDHECQFPTMTVNNMQYNFFPGKTDNFSRILENLDQILENKVVDLTQGATYFGQVSNLPPWLRRKIDSGEVERTTQAGKFTFYKEKNVVHNSSFNAL